jgi:RNA polymerase sigma-70 factor, ECF subfamily
VTSPLEVVRETGGGSDPAVETDRVMLRERLTAALAQLPERQREVLLLHDLEGYKHREIGELLGMPEGTVRYTLFQARRAARALLAEDSPMEDRDG